MNFQIKGVSKRQKLNVATESDEQKTELIVAIEKSGIETLHPQKDSEKKQLVIPLPQFSNDDKSDLLRQATEELINQCVPGSNADKSQKSNDLVIANSVQSSNRKTPLLLSGLPKSLIDIKNDDDRFKADINFRADDVSVKSEIYQNIPISDFGAAMLRGMGYSGPSIVDMTEKDTRPLVARENRLGLGALPKPPEKRKDVPKGMTKKDAKALEKDSLEKVWERRAKERIQGLNITIDSIVRVTDSNFNVRAKVIAISGVPGLNKIRLCLEEVGNVVDVDRNSVKIVSDEELENKPFVFPEKTIVISEDPKFYGLESKQETMKIVSKEQNSTNSAAKQPKVAFDAKKDWLLPNIRVKIISRKAGDKYLQKGTVLDVYMKGVASIRLDNGSIIESIKESALETVIPSRGESCIILSGAHRGEMGILLEKYREDDRVQVQLLEDLEVLELSMDDVAAFH